MVQGSIYRQNISKLAFQSPGCFPIGQIISVTLQVGSLSFLPMVDGETIGLSATFTEKTFPVQYSIIAFNFSLSMFHPRSPIGSIEFSSSTSAKTLTAKSFALYRH